MSSIVDNIKLYLVLDRIIIADQLIWCIRGGLISPNDWPSLKELNRDVVVGRYRLGSKLRGVNSHINTC